MKRRDFMAKGGGFLGLSLARFGQMKEGNMQKEPVSDPKKAFLDGIIEIRKNFPVYFNEGVWLKMGELYWEDAVLVSKRTNEVYQGRDKIVGFWKDFKEQKRGRKLASIQPKLERPLVQAVDLIGIMAMGEYNIYDMVAYDSCVYNFNPDSDEVPLLHTYRHRKTCTTAISETIFG